MLLFNRKQAHSVDFLNSKMQIAHHGDIALDILEHKSYVSDFDMLEIGFLSDSEHIVECDYCGIRMHRNRKWESKELGGTGGLLAPSYIDPDSEYPSTDDCCRECVYKKRMIFNFMKYGTVVDLKAAETRANNGNVPSSRPQIYLAELLGGNLNPYFKDVGYVDIVIEGSKTVIEYDGSGHFLGINFKKYTYDEKMLMDEKRDSKLIELGYKVIRICSKYDYLPSESVIVSEIKTIENLLSKSDCKFYRWDIPSSLKDLTFGRLRSVYEEDLKRGESENG